jgi:hypothetical protein
MFYRKHFVPHRDHGFSITKTDQLILLRETVAARCESHEILSVNGILGLNCKSSGTFVYHCALYG